VSRVFTITVAPNDARRGKVDHPALPISTEEIARTAKMCFDAGADAIHLHVRDKDGRHSLDAGRYRGTISAISTSAPLMAIQVTTEAAGIYDVPAQLACLEQLCPDAASVSVREMACDPDVAARLYAFADEAEIDLQHICYDLADVATLKRWQESGLVSKTLNDVLFVLGKYTPSVVARPSDLDPFLHAIAGWALNWSVCALGGNEAACLRYALEQGGDVRTGFENNIQLPNGQPARDNSELVAISRKAGLSLGLTPSLHPEPRP
jgi:uncharacterized protein (DUF849 family)